MQTDKWYCYNHTAFSLTDPHEEPDTAPIADGSIFQSGKGAPLLARWTTDFDCGRETNWWYVIKDTPFDINALKAKRRYEINKGNRNFDVREIDPSEWAEGLYAVAVAAYASYPEAYRPSVSHDRFVSDVGRWDFQRVYGAFSAEDGTLCGYACLGKGRSAGNCVHFTVMKTVPSCERLGINAAIVCKILEDHAELLGAGGYICDGERSVNHETAFQDYLEKYFAFRKAYCRLHVVYRPCVKLLVRMAYPFRRVLKKMGTAKLIGKLNALLRMEEIRNMGV